MKSLSSQAGNATLAGIAFLAIILAGLSLGTLVNMAQIDRRPPVTSFERVEVLNSPIQPGEALRVRIWREKVRGDCPVTSYRSASNRDGKLYDIPDIFDFEGGPPEQPYFEVSYHIPRTLPPDQYLLLVHLVYQCPDGLEFRYDQPPARFRVEGDTEGAP